jgi:hypothetical protein
MVKYNCDKCGKHFKQKQHLENHQNKINPCDTLIKTCESLKITENKRIDAETLKEYLNECKCVYCLKEFSRKDHVIYHIKHNCKKVKEIEDEKEQIFLRLQKLEDDKKNLEEENKKLREQLEKKNEYNEKNIEEKIKLMIEKKLKKQKSKKTISANNNKVCKIKDNSVDNSINDSTINNQQNIILNNYKGQDAPQIPDDELLAIYKRGFQAPVELTRKVHFNPKYPEFHNIYLPRINEKHGMIYVNDAWKLIKKNELVDDIYEHKRDYIIQHKDAFWEKLDANKKKSLKRWLDTDDNNDESIINTKEDIKRLLFDNRHLAMNRKKELDKKKKQLELVNLPKKIKEVNSDTDSDSDSDSDSSKVSNYSYNSNNNSD